MDYMKKYEKRGQVAIFAAIAVILIIVFGIILYVFIPDQASRGNLFVDEVSEEFSPIQEYVHSCVEQVGEDAVSILGLRGGYLFDRGYLHPGFYNLNPSQINPTESNSFYFMEGSNIVVPYWFHQSNSNFESVATFSSEKPQLKSDYNTGLERLQRRDQSIEAQIDNYVNFHLDKCLSDFQIFKEEGFNVSSETNIPTATTYVLDDGVQIQIYYPIEVSSEDSVQKMENFGVLVPVRLKKMYELAEFITRMEVENNFLETNMINLLIMNSMVGSKYFPPINDFAFEVGPGNRWQVSDVKENVRQLLYFTKMLQVQGAQNFKQVELEPVDYAHRTRQKTYDNMILPVVDLYSEELIDMETILPEVDIDFEYLDYPHYFNVNADGNEIKPDVYGIDLGGFSFGFQQYETRYDV
ncbi:hypothetical protein KY334_00265, partial [Candidatus Woesearchaeota archaeon]|nr:hypothetical protein [Candidatus Woesearchaeota archaeon]